MVSVIECQSNTNTTGNPNVTASVSPTTTIKPDPTTTSPSPPPTTIDPPKPVPTIISGNITDGNFTCLRYEFDAYFSVAYNTTNKTETVTFSLPKNAKLHYQPGVCGNETESFELTFQKPSGSLELFFKRGGSSVFLDTVLLKVTLTPEYFPNLNESLISKFAFVSIRNENNCFNLFFLLFIFRYHIHLQHHQI